MTSPNNTSDMTPDLAFKLLQTGHERFLSGKTIQRNLLKEMQHSRQEPQPFATILGCMDSRTPAELIFDQGMGAIFNLRIAGNIVTPHILGSLEFSIEIAGAKLIVVMGHSDCAAVKSACNHVTTEHFSCLLHEISVCLPQEFTEISNRTGNNEIFVNKVALLNVHRSVQQLLERSSIIRQFADSGKIKIIPAMYDVSTGAVTFHTSEQGV